MKITIYKPKSEFTKEQQKLLTSLGDVSFIDKKGELPLQQLINLAKGSDVIAPTPDSFGGFEKAISPLMKVIESLPKLKGVCLSTTSFGWIDLGQCKKKSIAVSNIPGYSRESVAEHALAMLLNLSKMIFISDRREQKGKYKIELGHELKGKTLGVIGLGNIGSRVAELGLGIGMKGIAYNRHPKKMKGVEMKSFDEVLKESDAISLNTTHEEANKHLIGSKELSKMKDGIIIVNTVDRELVDEEAMAKACKSGKVFGYAYEGEDLIHTPLAGIENAIGIQAFAWYTKEALENLAEIWVGNIEALAKGKPRNRVA
jgi:lactate dehydrogenase-like 2-hydroxyacid dehydrogenase